MELPYLIILEKSAQIKQETSHIEEAYFSPQLNLESAKTHWMWRIHIIVTFFLRAKGVSAQL